MKEFTLSERRVIAKALTAYKQNPALDGSYQAVHDYHTCCYLLNEFLNDLNNNKE